MPFYYILCTFYSFYSHVSDNLLSLSEQTDNVVILIITKLGDRCEYAIEVCSHGVYRRSRSWCIYKVALMVYTQGCTHGVYTWSHSWCIYKVTLMVYTQGRTHAVYTMSHSWCIHKVTLMVYTQGHAHGVYTRSRSWCIHKGWLSSSPSTIIVHFNEARK